MPDDRTAMPTAYEGLEAYWGDIHNHCDISYGHGSLDDALANARAQLDFTSVTAHAHWPDLPQDDERLAAVNAYHREGFERAQLNWPRYRDVMNAANEDGRFVTLLSFEWHSLLSGDHNIYYRGNEGEILEEPTLEAMDDLLSPVTGLAKSSDSWSPPCYRFTAGGRSGIHQWCVKQHLYGRVPYVVFTA